MRHLVRNKRLNRNSSHFRALMKNMAASLILHERIQTTEAKAKRVKSYVEKLITDVKKDAPLTTIYRSLHATLPHPRASRKLVEDLRARYKDRRSGYLRITHLGMYRSGDAARMVQISFV